MENTLDDAEFAKLVAHRLHPRFGWNTLLARDNVVRTLGAIEALTTSLERQMFDRQMVEPEDDAEYEEWLARTRYLHAFAKTRRATARAAIKRYDAEDLVSAKLLKLETKRVNMANNSNSQELRNLIYALSKEFMNIGREDLIEGLTLPNSNPDHSPMSLIDYVSVIDSRISEHVGAKS